MLSNCDNALKSVIVIYRHYNAFNNDLNVAMLGGIVTFGALIVTPQQHYNTQNVTTPPSVATFKSLLNAL